MGLTTPEMVLYWCHHLEQPTPQKIYFGKKPSGHESNTYQGVLTAVTQGRHVSAPGGTDVFLGGYPGISNPSSRFPLSLCMIMDTLEIQTWFKPNGEQIFF